MPSRALVVQLFLIALLTLAACSSGGSRQPDHQASAQLSFGVEMARQGLWKEALFRFAEAEKLDPDNPRIHSNLGVAYEASGQFDKALASYQKALQLAPNDKGIRANYSRFVEFYQGYKGEKKAGAPKTPTTTTATTNKAAPPPAPPTPPEPRKPGITDPSSIPGDTPPPPADNRPPV